MSDEVLYYFANLTFVSLLSLFITFSLETVQRDWSGFDAR